MLLTAVFTLAFAFRVALGIHKNKNNVSSLLANSIKKKQVIEIVIPQQQPVKKDSKTIDLITYLKEKREENLKPRTQKIQLTFFEEDSEIFLN